MVALVQQQAMLCTAQNDAVHALRHGFVNNAKIDIAGLVPDIAIGKLSKQYIVEFLAVFADGHYRIHVDPGFRPGR